MTDLQALLNKMTTREKLAQMTQFFCSLLMDDIDSEVTGPLATLGVSPEDTALIGSTLGTNYANDMITMQKKHLGNDPHRIPLLFMRDVIHGHRTIYPIPLGMGATWDVDTVKACCHMAAKEAAVSGIHVVFAPMVDVARDGRWGRVMETPSEDTYLNSVMAKAMVEGFQGDMTGPYDVAACVKHYAAYGAVESGRDYNTTDMSEHTLREYYLPPYRAAVDAGVEMVMTSFNTIGGVPSSGNRWLVHDILRNEWGFDNLVISDWNAFMEMIPHGFCEDAAECAEKAFATETDIEMASICYLRHGEQMMEEHPEYHEQLDRSVMRILRLKDKLGLFDNPYSRADEAEEKTWHLCTEHRALARRAAEQAAVLLKNERVLPLSRAMENIAVIGPFAKRGMLGNWACAGTEEEAVSAFDGIRAAAPDVHVHYMKGCDSALNATDYEEQAIALAKACDAVVLCVGEESDHSGEANSRTDITLPQAQKELIRRITAVNPRTVTVLYTGRPLALSDIIEDVPALLTMWQPGTEGGNALARLLFGEVNFEGKLTVTFPRCVGQLPLYYNHLRTGRPKLPDVVDPNVTRYLDSENTPLFPFGYGLSYTTFAIGEPTISDTTLHRGENITVSCTVTNTGTRDGSTVIQLYLNDKSASCARPVKELKAFRKIHLAAGEQVTVSFELTEEICRFHTASGRFEAENGWFSVYLSDRSDSGNPVCFELR